MRYLEPLKDPGVVESVVLSNGITLFHRQSSPQFGLPKIAGSIVVMAGGRDDPQGKEGSAHFFEHMPFRGTTQFPSLYELTHAIENNGGYINAFTTDEATGYEVIVPSSMLESGVERLSEMLLHPLMREEDLAIERNVITEELRNKHASVGFYARQQLYKNLLGDHPLLHAVIGTEEALNSITKDDLLAFHSRYYNASNMYLFFAGEYDTAELVRVCEQHFGSIPRGEVTLRDVKPTAPKLDQYTLSFTPTNYNRSVYLVGRLLPALNLEESLRMRLFTGMLAGGMNSPLTEEIREKRGLAYGLNLGYSTFHDLGILALSVSTRYKNMDEVDRIFWEQASQILTNQARFDEIKHMLKQKILFREYSVGSIVDNAVDTFLEYGAVISINDYLAALDKVTLDDVKAYVGPLLTKSEFLNIRVNCDKDEN